LASETTSSLVNGWGAVCAGTYVTIISDANTPTIKLRWNMEVLLGDVN